VHRTRYAERDALLAQLVEHFHGKGVLPSFDGGVGSPSGSSVLGPGVEEAPTARWRCWLRPPMWRSTVWPRLRFRERGCLSSELCGSPDSLSAALPRVLPAGAVGSDVPVSVALDPPENHPQIIRRMRAGLEDLDDVRLLHRAEPHRVVR
jgi:hypothetical protein